MKKTPGYVATVETEEHGFGSAECPWNIQVSAGQRINITLFNFARHSVAASGSMRPEVCYEIGEIKENGERKRITLCDALGRETSIYVSKSNAVSLQFVSGPTLRSLGAFLFKYDGMKCFSPVFFSPQENIKTFFVKTRKEAHLPQMRSLFIYGEKWVNSIEEMSF